MHCAISSRSNTAAMGNVVAYTIATTRHTQTIYIHTHIYIYIVVAGRQEK